LQIISPRHQHTIHGKVSTIHGKVSTIHGKVSTIHDEVATTAKSTIRGLWIRTTRSLLCLLS
jgi:hypothetical protein